MGIWDDFSPFVSAIGGTAIATAANTGAAAIAGDAARRGAQIQAENNLRAQQTLDQIRQQSAPGVSYLRQVVATPDTLTPSQQQALEDSRLATTNALNSSTFAGSGRAGAALFKRNESDFINGALDQNRQRAMTAGQTLAGENTNATTGIANSQTGTGKALGDAEAKAGLLEGQSVAANGVVAGKAIGDIGSYITSQTKLGRYGNNSTSDKPITGPNSYTRDSSYESGNSRTDGVPNNRRVPAGDYSSASDWW